MELKEPEINSSSGCFTFKEYYLVRQKGGRFNLVEIRLTNKRKIVKQTKSVEKINGTIVKVDLYELT